jgi:hypothetical protein
LYYSTYWYWIVWVADAALLLLPCIERPAYFNVQPWVALIIEIIALSILLASFLISMHLQNKRKLLREAVYPYIFTVVFIVNMNIYILKYNS